MKLWTWEHGRQGGGYRKLTIAFSKRFKFDLYILVVPTGSEVPPHNDPCPEGFEHHRVNVTLWKADIGGETKFVRFPGSLQPSFDIAPRHYHFRPDEVMHFVDRVLLGNLWLLSFGWLRKKA